MYTELCEMALRQTQPDFTFHFVQALEKDVRMQKIIHFRFSSENKLFFGFLVALLTDIASDADESSRRRRARDIRETSLACHAVLVASVVAPRAPTCRVLGLGLRVLQGAEAVVAAARGLRAARPALVVHQRAQLSEGR